MIYDKHKHGVFIANKRSTIENEKLTFAFDTESKCPS